jgi:hypothetical protein
MEKMTGIMDVMKKKNIIFAAMQKLNTYQHPVNERLLMTERLYIERNWDE